MSIELNKEQRSRNKGIREKIRNVLLSEKKPMSINEIVFKLNKIFPTNNFDIPNLKNSIVTEPKRKIPLWEKVESGIYKIK